MFAINESRAFYKAILRNNYLKSLSQSSVVPVTNPDTRVATPTQQSVQPRAQPLDSGGLDALARSNSPASRQTTVLDELTSPRLDAINPIGVVLSPFELGSQDPISPVSFESSTPEVKSVRPGLIPAVCLLAREAEKTALRALRHPRRNAVADMPEYKGTHGLSLFDLPERYAVLNEPAESFVKILEAEQMATALIIFEATQKAIAFLQKNDHKKFTYYAAAFKPYTQDFDVFKVYFDNIISKVFDLYDTALSESCCGFFSKRKKSAALTSQFIKAFLELNSLSNGEAARVFSQKIKELTDGKKTSFSHPSKFAPHQK